MSKLKEAPKHTINYAAKQAYQLFLMRGITQTTGRYGNPISYHCSCVVCQDGFVCVGIDYTGEPKDERWYNVKIRKSWRELI